MICINLCAAKCQHVCPEGRPSDDCSRCVCDSHVLHGQVQSVTGVPVPGAWVALASQPKVILARTDAKGLFRLPGICSSSSTLMSIGKDKFAPVAVSTSSNATGMSWLHAVLKSAGESSEKGLPEIKNMNLNCQVSLAFDGFFRSSQP